LIDRRVVKIGLVSRPGNGWGVSFFEKDKGLEAQHAKWEYLPWSEFRAAIFKGRSR
jgi:hypothetical protein